MRPTAPGVLADLQRDLSVVNIVGLSLELLGWVALVMFLGYLYRVLQRAEGPDGWLAPVAFGSGLIMVCIKLGSVAPLMAAWYRRDDLTVATATTLSDLGDALFVVSGWATGLLVASAAGSALVSGVLPRWLGWFGMVSGVADPRGRHRGDHGPGGTTFRCRSWPDSCGSSSPAWSSPPGRPECRSTTSPNAPVPTGVAARQ